MKPARDQIKEQIKEAFESARETPGLPYDEKEMIWYLVANPTGPRSIHNSFKGKRRLSRFLKSLETKFTVCFSQKDWWHLKSLEQIEERMAYLLDTPKSSLGSIRNAVNARPPDMLALLIFFLSLPIVAIGIKSFGMAGLCVLIIPGVIVWRLFRWDRKEKEFYRDLEAKIKANS